MPRAASNAGGRLARALEDEHLIICDCCFSVCYKYYHLTDSCAPNICRKSFASDQQDHHAFRFQHDAPHEWYRPLEAWYSSKAQTICLPKLGSHFLFPEELGQVACHGVRYDTDGAIYIKISHGTFPRASVKNNLSAFPSIHSVITRETTIYQKEITRLLLIRYTSMGLIS